MTGPLCKNFPKCIELDCGKTKKPPLLAFTINVTKSLEKRIIA